MVYKRNVGNYFIFNDNNILDDYACSSLKRPDNACKHFARINYKQKHIDHFVIIFIKDLNDENNYITVYTYDCIIKPYIHKQNENQYKRLQKYNIKIKQIKKEKNYFGNIIE